MKFATIAPEGSTWMNVLREFDKELQKETEGRLKLKIYPGGVSGDEKDVLRKIRFGQLHASGFTGFGLGEILSEVRVFEIPFLFDKVSELSLLREHLTPYFEKEFEKKGFVLSDWADAGFIHLYSKSPIKSADDLKKLKVWTWQGDPMPQAFFKGFGITPISLSLPDVLTSLQTGLIDTVYASHLAAIALQWFTKVEYVTDKPICFSVGAVVISKKFYDKVGKQDQAILSRLNKKYMARLRDLTTKENSTALKAMKKRGLKVVPFAQKDIQKFKDISVNVRQGLVGKLYPQDLLDKVLGILASAKEKAKESKKKKPSKKVAK
ncbi:TRAP transporter substrate-binding protein DctP [Elusimicrobiota bacterium]